jgi:transposase
MSQKLDTSPAAIGIDIGKNSFHIVGQNQRGAIVLRQKWSRGQVEARLANLPPCLIGMEACAELPGILATPSDTLSPRMQRVIEALASDLRFVDDRIEGLSSEIEELAKRDAGCQRLISIPGIGPIISSAMVAAIGTGDAFTKGRDFAAWLGLVPKQISTGDRTILGKISKRGNRYLRVLFVQAAWVVLVKVKPARWEGHGLKPWIEAAKKRLHHNVLAIALANKLARIAWSVLARGRAFEASKLQAA